MIPPATGSDLVVEASLLTRDAATFACLLLGSLLLGREWWQSRWKRRLNQALHELRRPVQVLALSEGMGAKTQGPGHLDLAILALGDLDATLNGTPRPDPAAGAAQPREAAGDSRSGVRTDAAGCRELIEAADRRWRRAVRASGRDLHTGETPDVQVAAGSTAISRALDNLLANALEHARGEIRLSCKAQSGYALLTVRDGGPRRSGREQPATSAAGQGPAGLGPDQGSAGAGRKPAIPGADGGSAGTDRDGQPEGADGATAGARRGHGVGLVRSIARRAGGDLVLHRGADGTRAVLQLPLATAGEQRR